MDDALGTHRKLPSTEAIRTLTAPFKPQGWATCSLKLIKYMQKRNSFVQVAWGYLQHSYRVCISMQAVKDEYGVNEKTTQENGAKSC